MLVTRSTSDSELDLLQGAKGVFCFKLLGGGETLRSWGDASSIWSQEQLDLFLKELIEDGLSCGGWDALLAIYGLVALKFKSV